jgi:hypothetical protein
VNAQKPCLDLVPAGNKQCDESPPEHVRRLREPLPCRCGERARVIEARGLAGGSHGHYVICSRHACCQPGSGVFVAREDAVRIWNRQVAEDDGQN